MRRLFLLTSLFGVACGNPDAPCQTCNHDQRAEHAQPALSSGELEKQLDEIERQIEADGGAR
jgi:hypothetical protein